MKISNILAKKQKEIDAALGIEISKLEDGTKIIKMGNNVYEFPVAVNLASYDKKAS